MNKNNQTKMRFFILLTLMLTVSQIAFSQSSGGSNYALYDAGTYPNDPCHASTTPNACEPVWYARGNLKPVIGTYHLDPNKVYQQLAAMRQGGQQKITLILWYVPFEGASLPPYAFEDNVWGHVVNADGDHLTLQHQQNLRNILTHIRDLGFNELDFRFSSGGALDASAWPSWNEYQYQIGWNFIVNTRAIVEQTLGGSHVRRLYDLGAELGGLNIGQLRAYTKRLWSDYCWAFGRADTYGFSFAVAPGRLPAQIAVYDETGQRPNFYAFDMYGDEYNTLAYLREELQSRGEQAKPIIIQEAYYNDAQSAQNFRLARQFLGLNILYVMQWQNVRGSGIPHFSVHWPEQYSNYVENPKIEAAGTGCADNYCIWIRGESFDPVSYVDIRRVDGAGEILARVDGTSLTHDNNSSAPRQLLTFAITDPNLRAILNNPGIRVWVVNPYDGRWSNGVAVRRQ